MRDVRKSKRKTGAAERRPIPAKIAKPKIAGVYPRERLFQRLDAALTHPVIWLSAPAGAGKTTLIASYLQQRNLPSLWYQVDLGDRDVASFFYYMSLAANVVAPKHATALPLLTPEYAHGLSVFSANYFRDLFGRLKRGSVVVLDNYQEIGLDGGLQELLPSGLEQIPSGMNVIVISREPPPPTFARLRASRNVTLVGWKDLRLTEEEASGVARLRTGAASLTAPALSRLNRYTQGWVAGLVLLTENADHQALNAAPEQSLASETLFDYFANEIFRRADPVTQSFFLNTAFLPKVPTATAPMEGVDNHSILRDLARRNYFTVERPDGSFEYHPLFRAFLVRQATAILGPASLRRVKQQSAALLIENGDIDSAVALLKETKDWELVLDLCIRQAPALIEQGRTKTLESWFDGISAALREQNAWALYWQGMCRLAFTPVQARSYFERAFALFEKGDDASPLYRVWAAIIESFVLVWDDCTGIQKWLDRYATLANKRSPPSPEVEASSVFTYVSALTHSSYEQPATRKYVEIAEGLLEREVDIGRCFSRATPLIAHYLWSGNLQRMGHLLDRLARYAETPNAPPLARLAYCAWRSLLKGGTGFLDESIRATNEGLALAQSSGIHLFDSQLLAASIWGHLCAGNVDAARDLVPQMAQACAPGRIAEAHFGETAACVALQSGDLAEADRLIRRTIELVKDSGMVIGHSHCLITLAIVLAIQGHTEDALERIAEARELSASIHSKLRMYQCAIAEAFVSRRSDPEQSLRALCEALAVGREMDIVTPASIPRSDAAHLYAMALDADIEPDFARQVIFRTHLPPPPGTLPERWPWAVRLFTLGRFSVLKEEAPLDALGRAQQKPLELLRVLIALGGEHVSTSKIAQILWPDAEGDMIKGLIQTSVHRLRRLIGEHCILRQENQLSLNREYCWLDVWAFEQFLETERKTLAPSERARRLLALYRGSFLADEDVAWVLVPRERLRAKFLRAVIDEGDALEGRAAWHEGAEFYQQVIDIEPLAEEVYYRLMRCHQRLDSLADALAIYRRCHDTLLSLLRIEPTAKTKALYGEIVRGVS